MNTGGFFRSVVGTPRGMTSESQPTNQQQIIVTAQDVSRQIYEKRKAKCDAFGIKNIGTLESHSLRKGMYALRSSLCPSNSENPAIFCSLAGVLPDEEWEVVGIVQNAGSRERGELPAVLIAGLSWAYRSNGVSVFRDGDFIGLRAPTGGRPSPLAGTEGIPEGAVLPEIFPFTRLHVAHLMDRVNQGLRKSLVDAVQANVAYGGPNDALKQAARQMVYHDIAWGVFYKMFEDVIGGVGGAPATFDNFRNNTRGVGGNPAVDGDGDQRGAYKTILSSKLIAKALPANPTRGDHEAVRLYNEALNAVKPLIEVALADFYTMTLVIDNIATVLGVPPHTYVDVAGAHAADQAGVSLPIAWMSVGLDVNCAPRGAIIDPAAPPAAAMTTANILDSGGIGAAVLAVVAAPGVLPAPQRAQTTGALARAAFASRNNAYLAAIASFNAATAAYTAHNTTDGEVIRIATLPSAERMAIVPTWDDAAHARIRDAVSGVIENLARTADSVPGARNGPMERYAWFVYARLGFPNDNWYLPQGSGELVAYRNAIENAVSSVWRSGDVVSKVTDVAGPTATAESRAVARIYDSPTSSVTSDEITTRLMGEQIEFMKKRVVGFCSGPSASNSTTLDLVI